MQLTKSLLFSDSVYLIEPKVYRDSRGCFYENFNNKVYKEIGLNGPWLQDNISKTSSGSIRGLHFQNPYSQGKLVSVICGSIFDVVVDIRKNSPTFGEWTGVELDDINCNQLWVPPGFAHGFQVISEIAYVNYKCTDSYWSPENEEIIVYNDVDIGVKWPKPMSYISIKDKNAKTLKNTKNLPLFINND